MHYLVLRGYFPLALVLLNIKTASTMVSKNSETKDKSRAPEHDKADERGASSRERRQFVLISGPMAPVKPLPKEEFIEIMSEIFPKDLERNLQIADQLYPRPRSKL